MIRKYTLYYLCFYFIDFKSRWQDFRKRGVISGIIPRVRTSFMFNYKLWFLKSKKCKLELQTYRIYLKGWKRSLSSLILFHLHIELIYVAIFSVKYFMCVGRGWGSLACIRTFQTSVQYHIWQLKKQNAARNVNLSNFQR